MDPPPPVPPPLPFPPSLAASSKGSNTPSKKRGRPPGSRNRVPATNGGGSVVEPNRPNLDTASTVISALKFPLPGPPPRPTPAPTVKKAASSSSSSSTNGAVAPPVAPPPPTNGRAPRASKVNANLRMVDAARRDNSPPPSPPTPKAAKIVPVVEVVPPPAAPPPAKPVVLDPSAPSLHKNPAIAFRSLPKATPLDFKTVKTKGPRIPPPRTEPRAFGLTEAPTFYPSKEEFQNPMEYIRWCGEEGGASQFGICKIVPPDGWQPPFVMNTEVSQLSGSRGAERTREGREREVKLTFSFLSSSSPSPDLQVRCSFSLSGLRENSQTDIWM